MYGISAISVIRQMLAQSFSSSETADWEVMICFPHRFQLRGCNFYMCRLSPRRRLCGFALRSLLVLHPAFSAVETESLLKYLQWGSRCSTSHAVDNSIGSLNSNLQPWLMSLNHSFYNEPLEYLPELNPVTVVSKHLFKVKSSSLPFLLKSLPSAALVLAFSSLITHI
jgi:hypothetical protein